jgi:arylsulfatase A-like enzyme
MKLSGLHFLIPAMAWGVNPSAAADPKPNIVFIMADDLGWSDLGAMGSKFYQTPNIDRLAKKGMLFTNAYAANPLCSPTRAGVLTGLHPQRTGFTAPAGHVEQEVFEASLAPTAQPWARAQNVASATRLDTRFTTYAELLHEAGYRTAHFGKWHVGHSPYMPTNHGFDIDIPSWNVPGPAQGYVYPWNITGHPELPGDPGEQLEERMGREVAAFIRDNKDRPFFVNYWAFTPHSPYNGRPDLIEKHRARVDRTNPQQSATMAAMIESLDNAVGTVLSALDESGVADNTIVVLTSDNGGSTFGDSDGVLPTSNSPLKGGKGTIYEGGIRVPLIVDWPGVTKPGSVSSALVQSTDFFATFLEMAGVELPADCPGDGVSIVPILTGGKESVRDAVYTYFPHNVDATGNLSGAAVRRGDDKLIRYFAANPDGSDRLELYDLAADIGETRDLAAEKPGVAAELNDLLTAYLKETGAPTPGKNPDYNPDVPRPWEVDALHGRLPKGAPQIGNGSFEKPGLTGAKAQLTPPIRPREDARVAEWDFGLFTGISRAGEGPAEGASAADGSQMAFLRGDLRVNDAPLKIRNAIGIDITGLLPGRKYELSWQQMARPANRANAQLAVDLNVPERKPFAIHEPAPVANKEAWKKIARPFVAISPEMRLNFRHSVAEPHDEESGEITTLIDAVRVRELD